MRIAMVGTRGVPATYSGFETFVEELGARLVERRHRVTVYCRRHHVRYRGRSYRGMRLVSLPTVRNKYLDTIAHTALSCLHLLPHAYDIVLMCIAGNSPAAIIPRLGGVRVALNVDGLDWTREKWPGPAKRYLRLAEWLATKFADAVVTDSRAVAAYYREEHKAEVEYIPYGTAARRPPPGATLARLGLEPGRYLLYVGRLVPENCAHHLVEAFGQLRPGVDMDAGMKCVAGDAPYVDALIADLKGRVLGPNVLFLADFLRRWLLERIATAVLEIFAAVAPGMHPALLEALGSAGLCTIVADTPTTRDGRGVAAGPTTINAVRRRW
ncbi:MAG: DUF1972 domain-containing protein [Chloroflexia bacterium]